MIKCEMKQNSSLKKIIKELGIKYEEKIGEAAFYGPKVDIQILTALNHEVTVSTIQLDFLLPQKFEISYTNSENNEEVPVLIHRGLIGTYERFISILIEQTKGNLPFWLAPKQVTIIPVNENTDYEYAKEVNDKLLALDIRSKVDFRNERLSKKVREAQISKSKFQVILGEAEKTNKTISYRRYGEEKTTTTTFEEFSKMLLELKASYE